jgi:hypothetical protein
MYRPSIGRVSAIERAMHTATRGAAPGFFYARCARKLERNSSSTTSLNRSAPRRATPICSAAIAITTSGTATATRHQRNTYQRASAHTAASDSSSRRAEVAIAAGDLRDAVTARWEAEQRLSELYRERAIARGRAAERDPNAALN